MKAKELFGNLGWEYTASCRSEIKATYEKRHDAYGVLLVIEFANKGVYLSHGGFISMDVMMAIQKQIEELGDDGRWNRND